MYDQFYGFTGRPFQLTPDPEFYFESVSHKKAMSYLGYGLSQGEGFIVITGEVGAGKSTLVAHLMERIDPAALTVAQVVTSALDGAELVHCVAQAFGLVVEGQDKASALGAIEQFLQDEAREGRRALLVVDECQNLDLTALEELRMLSNFQLGSHPLLQSLLLGQPEFRRTLAQHPDLEQLRQRVIASHHLDALDEDEVEAYVRHRLEHVDWNGRPALDSGLLGALYGATGGIPRRVNQVMNRLLLFAAIEEKEEIGSGMLEAVMAEMNDDQARGSRAEASPLSIEPESTEAQAAPAPAAPANVFVVDKAPEPLDQAAQADELELNDEYHAEPEDEVEEFSEIDAVCDAEGSSAQAVDPAEAREIDAVPATEVAALLAERDAHTAELEAAISELQAAGAQPELPSDIVTHDAPVTTAQVDATLERIEARLEEQERSFRHVLTMLIEWLEDETSREAA